MARVPNSGSENGGQSVESNGQNRGGRAYLKAELKEQGISRRRAVAILDLVFEEMGLALRRGEYVESPFGYLYAYKRVSQRWKAVGDEPMRPYFVKLMVDEEGERLFEGEKRTPWPEGWSRKPDKRSIVYRRDQSLKRSGKAERTCRPEPEESGKVASKRAQSGK